MLLYFFLLLCGDEERFIIVPHIYESSSNFNTEIKT